MYYIIFIISTAFSLLKQIINFYNSNGNFLFIIITTFDDNFLCKYYWQNPVMLPFLYLSPILPPMAWVKQNLREHKPPQPLRYRKPLCTMVAHLPVPLLTVNDQVSFGSDHSESMHSFESGIDITWQYNKALCLIQHEPYKCFTCKDYIYHYKMADNDLRSSPVQSFSQKNDN